MLRRLVTAIVTVALALGATIALAGPAQAAKPTLIIGTIATQTIGWNDTVVVKPKVSKRGAVKISSSRLTVSKDGRSVAKSKASVSLRQGSYRVTTVVKYRVKKAGRYGATKTKKKTQTLRVNKPTGCATRSDYTKVKTVEMYLYDEVTEAEVDTMASVARDMRSSGKSEGAATLGELYDYSVSIGDDEAAEDFRFFAEDIGYGWDAVFEIRSYALCKRRERAEVVYVDIDPWFKEIVKA